MTGEYSEFAMEMCFADSRGDDVSCHPGERSSTEAVGLDRRSDVSIETAIEDPEMMAIGERDSLWPRAACGIRGRSEAS